METSLVKSVPSAAPTVTQEKTQRGALFSALGIGLSLIGLFAIGGLFLEIPGLVFALYARQRGGEALADGYCALRRLPCCTNHIDNRTIFLRPLLT
jgi:hypothetical protein